MYVCDHTMIILLRDLKVAQFHCTVEGNGKLQLFSTRAAHQHKCTHLVRSVVTAGPWKYQSW